MTLKGKVDGVEACFLFTATFDKDGDDFMTACKKAVKHCKDNGLEEIQSAISGPIKVKDWPFYLKEGQQQKCPDCGEPLLLVDHIYKSGPRQGKKGWKKSCSNTNCAYFGWVEYSELDVSQRPPK